MKLPLKKVFGDTKTQCFIRQIVQIPDVRGDFQLNFLGNPHLAPVRLTQPSFIADACCLLVFVNIMDSTLQNLLEDFTASVPELPHFNEMEYIIREPEILLSKINEEPIPKIAEDTPIMEEPHPESREDVAKEQVKKYIYINNYIDSVSRCSRVHMEDVEKHLLVMLTENGMSSYI